MELLTAEEFSKLSDMEQKDAMIEALHGNIARMEELADLKEDHIALLARQIELAEELVTYAESAKDNCAKLNAELTKENALLRYQLSLKKD